MAEPINADDGRYLPSASNKSKAPNLSSGWVAMLLSGLIAAAVFLFVTQQGSQKFSVEVVTVKLQPGQVITSASLGRTNVNLPQGQLDRLVQAKDLASLQGWIVVSPLQPGDLLSKSALKAPGAPDGMRAMSLPVSQSRAVAGALRTGDRIDVVDTIDGFPGGFAGKDLQVLSVNSSGSSSLGGGGDFSLTLAVSADDAVNLSKAIASGKFDVLRSTGATPLPDTSTAAATVTTEKKA